MQHFYHLFLPSKRTACAKHTCHKVSKCICIFLVCSILITLSYHSHNSLTSTTAYHQKLTKQLLQSKNFDDFTDLYFKLRVTEDSITTAYTLQNPSKYKIPDLQPCLSSFNAASYQLNSKSKHSSEALSQIQEQLHHFSTDNLSKQDTLTYALLDQQLTLQQKLSQFPYYEDLLGPTSGIQTNLPVTLCEYPLNSEEDIKCYLQLLSQVPNYFDNIIAYEKARTKQLCPLPPFLLLDIQDNITSLINNFSSKQSCFVQTFSQRIQKIKGLSPEERKKYIVQNQALIKSCIQPAYATLLSYVNSLLENPTNNTHPKSVSTALHHHTNAPNTTSTPNTTATSNTPSTPNTTSTPNKSESEPQSSSRNKARQPKPNVAYGLSTLPNGAAYYSLLVESNTGSSKTPKEMISLTDKTLYDTLAQVKQIALTNPDIYLYYCDHPASSSLESPEAILDTLSLQIRQNYPVLNTAPACSVKKVPNSLSTYLSPAFYMIPAIDTTDNNTIYINPLYTNLEQGNLFVTLAHEGYPGHLYQTNYFNSTNPPLVRQLLDYPGYVEGWATYAELQSFAYLNGGTNPPDLIKLYQADTIISLALSARVDLGVNYESWTLNDVNDFFQKLGFKSYYTADLYSYVLESPATYLRYFIGYLEITELKSLYQSCLMNSYTDKDFHQQLLTLGPADFNTLQTFLLSPTK